jgi:hypothetical protein
VRPDHAMARSRNTERVELMLEVGVLLTATRRPTFAPTSPGRCRNHERRCRLSGTFLQTVAAAAGTATASAAVVISLATSSGWETIAQ